MLFNYRHLDEFDASEDCIVSKIFLGIVFNRYLPANAEWEIAKGFLRFYINDIDDLDFSDAEVLIKPKFSWFSKDGWHFKDHTAPDVLLHFPNQTLIAIEAKYTLPIQSSSPAHLPHQLLRECEHLSNLKELFGTKDKYLFLLMTHQRLFAHLKGPKDNIGRRFLLQCSEQFGDSFRMNTWNCIYHLVKNTNEKQFGCKNEILRFLEQKRNYMNNAVDGTKRGLVSLITKENGDVPSYGWGELKHLLGTSVNDYPAYGHRESPVSEEISTRSTSYEKPRWKRCKHGPNRFDLCCINPDKIDTKELRILFDKVLNSESGFGRPYRKSAAAKFFQWLANPRHILAEEAFACLSNWFLTDHPSAKRSQRADASRDLWHKLFNTAPQRRITPTKSVDNCRILQVPFEAWWELEQNAVRSE